MAARNSQTIDDSTTNYYRFLGVHMNATSDEIRKSFISKARQIHPDKNFNQPDSQDLMKYLNEAYETLSNKVTRAEYDENLLEDASSENLRRQTDLL